MADAPTRVADISAEWLTDALGDRVDEFTCEVIGSGEGFMGQLARVHLVRHRGASDSSLPSSVIVKLPTADPGGQMIGQMMRVWERELRFYSDIAPRITGVNIARCLNTQADPYVLILEDLHPRTPGDQVAGPTAEQARTAIDAAAALHSAWFDHPDLSTFDWMPDLDDPMSASVGAMFEIGWPTFLARYADSLSRRVIDWCERFVPNIPSWMQSYKTWPPTLTHGDFRLDNMFFDADGAVTLIDWQLSMRCPSTTDLVYFLGTNIPTEMRRELQGELIERYAARMREGGVPAEWADPERITQGYAEGCLFYCTSFAASILTLDPANARGAALMDSLVRRAFSSADDLDAGGRLGL